ncbi:bifunctional 4-hydroxy-2-oxoglutarate aldolase/2-dehydro-3-deoxy-phosphogluconate aldolase [Limibacter armeniacum]|uniref:bifunctional 4-hydroxy-2-oxoglutarate aldolase/2-dehydro-3-deoxy-phosphogluconate aldolase n=1 Tax=Limibacter armeniacum TaxID=466084 RepID=UPI002FE51780
MARFSRIEVAVKAYETGIIPVFYHQDFETCKEILTACYRARIRVFEFTNRGDFAHETFGKLIKFAAEELPHMILGIGSVLDPATAALYMQLGTNFVVSPVMNPEMAKVCNRRKVAWMPGCGSLSEISEAEELGAEVVKIFPAEQVGGLKFIQAAKGPCPWSSIMPTGGIEPEKEMVTHWLKGGAHCVGIGSKLFPKNEDGSYNLIQIESKLSELTEAVREMGRTILNVEETTVSHT